MQIHIGIYTAHITYMSICIYRRYIYICVCVRIYIIEGSLEVKLPTIWTDKKQRWEEQEKRREEQRREEKRRRKKIKKRKSPTPKKEDSGGRQGRDSLCFSNDLSLRRVGK